ncbi:hypothetical protein ACIREE_33505 [Streptomyces sp. NPDC102467]|uniref:hypothetical protein n=1 Tax=Streptomyces sp. NPDC102467 TaxID=3366179 RepID=UPI003818AA9C
MDTAHAVVLARGKFIDYTHVGWLDVLLNIAVIAALWGLFAWIAGAWRDRRPRPDEPEKKGPSARTRMIALPLSVVGALVMLATGIVVRGDAAPRGEDASFLIVAGLVVLVFWAAAGWWLRPGARARRNVAATR